MIKKAYVDTSQGQIHYRYSVSASETGRPSLVLLHQTPSSSVMYEPLMIELAQDYKVFAFDLPGFGESEELVAKLTIGVVAECLLEAMCQLQIEDYFLFGHHTGASIAVEMASYQPLAVKSLALSGPPLLNEALRQLLPSKATAIPLSDDGTHLNAMWERIQGKDKNASLTLMTREVRLALALGERYPQAYDAVIEHPMGERLAALQVPTLILSGTEDPLYGQLGAAAKLISNCRQFVLEDAGTYSCETHTKEIAEELRSFFQSHR